MGLLKRLRDGLRREQIPTELFVPAPAFPAYQPGPLVPDFIPALPDPGRATEPRPELRLPSDAAAPRRRSPRPPRRGR
jgi:hypothetical protein